MTVGNTADYRVRLGLHGCLLLAAFAEIKGTLMNATLIAANTNAPSREAGLGAKSEAEPETDCTRKNGNDIVGYTAYLGVDEG